MNIHLSDKVKFGAVSFAVAFAAVMAVFLWKPHIVRSRNRYLRAFFVFAIAFIPGVLAASICAKTITTVFEKAFSSEPVKITMEVSGENEEKEEEKEDDERGEAV